MKKKQGFTLIELLVVIAIIGILSSVVLASLNTARSKGSDAAVKAQLSSLRAEAALYYEPTNTYVGFFDAGQKGKQLLDAALASGGTGSTAADYGTSDTEWAAAVPLKTDNNIYFCVDDSGFAGTSTATAIDSTATTPDLDCQ